MAKSGLFSSRLIPVSLDSLPTTISSAVTEIMNAMPQTNARLVQWHDGFVGICAELSVSLPSRGPVRNIDIRKREPVVIVVDVVRYPYRALTTHPDRLDFPVSKLPHMSPGFGEYPPAFCLHRGSIDDWFAEHSLGDYVRRVMSWLDDAASGHLMRAQDFFEPARIDPNGLFGLAVFEPGYVVSFVERCTKVAQQHGLAGLVCSNLRPDIADKPILYVSDVYPFRSPGQAMLSLSYSPWSTLVGLLIYLNPTRPCHDYIAKLPRHMRDLLALLKRLGIDASREIEQLIYERRTRQVWLPIVVAIPRPRPLIGLDTSIELLGFAIRLEQGVDDRLVQASNHATLPMVHFRPLTRGRAAELSNTDLKSIGAMKIMIIGCGAIGSKVTLHLARAGVTSLTLIDDDAVQPHNLIRHGLLANSLGSNKAVALKAEIDRMYWLDAKAPETLAIARNVIDILVAPEGCKDHDWIVDCSASAQVLSALVDSKLGYSTRVLRCEIADRGRLGIALVEGPMRNPRLDDLQALLYDSAIDDDGISEWLQSQRTEAEQKVGPALEEISVGLGCSSFTMRLADDQVSFHAASASLLFRKVLETANVGGIYTSCLDATSLGGSESGFTRVCEQSLLAVSGTSEWSVRIPASLESYLRQQMDASKPDETGGLLLGFIHPKRKIIYVTRSLPPPADSRGWPFAFRLGSEDIPEELIKIHERTGGLIRYVGEWHSHPAGSGELSSTDNETLAMINRNLKRQQPAHVMIVTPEGCTSHLMA